MAKNYAQDFKEKYSFLEEYGFVFAVDPFNSNRPCYKNLYGEIILWFTHHGSIGSSLELYVQINGWKKTINVKEDYKKYVGKSHLFKPMEKLVKELFEARVKQTGEFYGLKVSKISGFSLNEETSLESFDAYYNPLEQKKKTALVVVLSIIFGILFIGQMFLAIAIDSITNLQSIFMIRNIIYISMIVMTFGLTIILRKQLSIMVKLLFNIFPIVSFITLYVFEKRIDFSLCFLMLGICTLFCIYYIFLYIFKKDNMDILNAVCIMYYPLVVNLIKLFNLNNYLFFNDDKLRWFLIVGVVISLIILIIAIVKIEDKSNKKEYSGKLCAAFFVPLLITVLIPYLFTQGINYSFDDSIGIKHQFLVVDKNTRYGGRGGPNYYLVIMKDGERESISVNKYLYEKFNEGSYIELEKHDGFLNIQYFEYVLEE